jgi:hypothetical protein
MIPQQDLMTLILKEKLPPGQYSQQAFTEVKDGKVNTIIVFTPIVGDGQFFFCPSYVKQDHFANQPIQGRFMLFVEAKTLGEAFESLDAQAAAEWEDQYKPEVIKQFLKVNPMG